MTVQDIFPALCHWQGLSSAPRSIVQAGTAAPSLTPAAAPVLINMENEKQLLVSFQEYQQNKKLVPS